jgi:MFS transporter, SHS family, lactate transporter
MSAAAVPWWREPTRAQWTSFGAAWAGWVLDGFDFTIFLLVMPAIAREFGVSYVQTTLSVTLTLVMRLVGGFAAGAMADRWGRKLPLMISIVWFALCDGLVAFAPTFAWVVVLRTLFGFGMGAEWTSGATLAMENWPQRSRGIASGILQGSWAIGYILAAVASAAIVPLWGWRALFLVAAVPALLVLPIRIWVPESPSWKASRATEPAFRMAEFLEGALLRRLVWGCLVWAFAFGIYYGLIGAYSPLVVKELGHSVSELSFLVVLFNLGMMAGAIACGVTANRWGVFVALIGPALLLLPVLPLYTGAVPGWLAVGAFLGGTFGAGISGVTPLLLTLLFPPRVRARSVAVVYHVGALLAAFTPTIVALLAERTGGTFARATMLVSGSSALLMIAALLLRPRSALPEESLAAPSASSDAVSSAVEPRSTNRQGGVR